jgi:hypothetical protein
MKTRIRNAAVAGLICGSAAFHGCKTTTESSEKSALLENAEIMSLQEWTTACQKELAHPTTGIAAKKELQQVADTTDCVAAYPTVKGILEQVYHRT